MAVSATTVFDRFKTTITPHISGVGVDGRKSNWVGISRLYSYMASAMQHSEVPMKHYIGSAASRNSFRTGPVTENTISSVNVPTSSSISDAIQWVPDADKNNTKGSTLFTNLVITWLSNVASELMPGSVANATYIISTDAEKTPRIVWRNNDRFGQHEHMIIDEAARILGPSSYAISCIITDGHAGKIITVNGDAPLSTNNIHISDGASTQLLSDTGVSQDVRSDGKPDLAPAVEQSDEEKLLSGLHSYTVPQLIGMMKATMNHLAAMEPAVLEAIIASDNFWHGDRSDAEQRVKDAISKLEMAKSDILSDSFMPMLNYMTGPYSSSGFYDRANKMRLIQKYNTPGIMEKIVEAGKSIGVNSIEDMKDKLGGNLIKRIDFHIDRLKSALSQISKVPHGDGA